MAEPIAIAIAFEGGKDVAIGVKVWWISKPRELCQLFVPWGRTVVVSGTTTILCRSEQVNLPLAVVGIIRPAKVMHADVVGWFARMSKIPRFST